MSLGLCRDDHKQLCGAHRSLFSSKAKTQTWISLPNRTYLVIPHLLSSHTAEHKALQIQERAQPLVCDNFIHDLAKGALRYERGGESERGSGVTKRRRAKHLHVGDCVCANYTCARSRRIQMKSSCRLKKKKDGKSV